MPLTGRLYGFGIGSLLVPLKPTAMFVSIDSFQWVLFFTQIYHWFSKDIFFFNKTPCPSSKLVHFLWNFKWRSVWMPLTEQFRDGTSTEQEQSRDFSLGSQTSWSFSDHSLQTDQNLTKTSCITDLPDLAFSKFYEHSLSSKKQSQPEYSRHWTSQDSNQHFPAVAYIQCWVVTNYM